jgi:hypothetical protein
VAIKKLKNIYNLLQQHVVTVCGWGFFTATIHVVNDVAYVILLCCRGVLCVFHITRKRVLEITIIKTTKKKKRNVCVQTT